MIEAIKVVIKKILQKSAGSLKIKTPTKTVPTAPIPVQTAYAVPIGNVCVALYNNSMLMVRQIKNPIIHKTAVVPEFSLALPKQVAKPTSNKPPIISKIQFIFIVSKSILKALCSTKYCGFLLKSSNFRD